MQKEFRNIYLKDRIKYTDEEYDITIIEIKEGDGIKNFSEKTLFCYYWRKF